MAPGRHFSGCQSGRRHREKRMLKWCSEAGSLSLRTFHVTTRSHLHGLEVANHGEHFRQERRETGLNWFPRHEVRDAEQIRGDAVSGSAVSAILWVT